jgi:OFA family oxalate/formate antiporter-like MFS transporter
MLYTAKGTAALLVPFAPWLAERSGWSPVFMVAAILNFAAAGLAILVLKPARVRAVGAVLIPDAMGIPRV